MLIDVRYPEVVLNIRDVKAAIDAGDKVGEMLEVATDDADENITIKDSTLSGIERREKVLGIKPMDTASIEDRRLEVLIRWYDTPIYTEVTLRQKLDSVLGVDNYVLVIDLDNKIVECKIELTRKMMSKSVRDLFEQMIPLDYLIAVTLRYNTWEKVKKLTWTQAKERTWRQVKEEAI